MLVRVNGLSTLEAPLAIAVICALLFIEEVGVPLPMFPGDMLLLTAGVLIATGSASPWVVLPIAYASVVAGGLTGYAWSRRIGSAALAGLAGRLRLGRHLDRASRRLHRTGVAGIIVGRLLPGTRVYTTLVAGSTGMPFRSYVPGLITSSSIWMAGYVGLGVAVGIPVAAHLHQLEVLALLVAFEAAVALAALLSLRTLRPPAGPSRPHPLRIAVAAGTDLFLVGLLADLAHGVLLHNSVGPTLAACLAALAYAVVIRLGLGATIGERLAGVSYASLQLRPAPDPG